MTAVVGLPYVRAKFIMFVNVEGQRGRFVFVCVHRDTADLLYRGADVHVVCDCWCENGA